MLENAPEIMSALSIVASFVNDFGMAGVIALILCIPVVPVLAVFVLDFYRQRLVRQEEEARRKEVHKDRELIRELVERHREQAAALVEGHRREAAAIMRALGDNHAEVVQFYRDNVELVKVTQRMAGDMRDIILNNTRAVERLSGAIETNFHCPMVREAAKGKK